MNARSMHLQFRWYINCMVVYHFKEWSYHLFFSFYTDNLTLYLFVVWMFYKFLKGSLKPSLRISNLSNKKIKHDSKESSELY